MEKEVFEVDPEEFEEGSCKTMELAGRKVLVCKEKGKIKIVFKEGD